MQTKLNTIVWGFDTYISCYAIQGLEKENHITVKQWYGNAYFQAVKVRDWYDIILKPIDKTMLLRCDKSTYDFIYSHLAIFLDLCARCYVFENKPIHECINAMHLLMDYYYNVLKKEEINLILMDDIPHGPATYILYLLAKALNIKVLMMLQSHFPNRFYYFETIEDYGWFKEVPEYNSSENKVIIQKKYEKNWFYADENWNAKPSTKTFADWKTKNINKFKRSLRKYDGIYDMILQKTMKKLNNYYFESQYRTNYKKIFTAKVDLSQKYVYFPLHLQPEMTTSILGGIYNDQLLAIEKTASLIPDDWQVYVKEYPKQTHYMRGKYFFERLSLTPKVRTVSSDVNTYDLIRNSQFVATLVGTAGWEAISGGKNTLIFGHAWYRSLPGVFAYSEDISLTDILSYKINHQELEEKLAVLLTKTGDAMISTEYLPLVGDSFDPQENNKKMFNFLVKMLPKI